MKTDALSNIVAKLRLSTSIQLRAHLCGNWALDSHQEYTIPFHVIGSGVAWLHVEHEPMPKRLNPGDLIFLPGNQAHVISHDHNRPDPAIINRIPQFDDTSYTSILCGHYQFNSQASWPLLESLPEVVVMAPNDFADGSGLLVQIIRSELDKGETPGSEAVVKELAYILFIQVLRTYMQREPKQGLLAALADRYIGKALNLIHQDSAYNWSVVDLAVAVNMSRTAFSNRFRELTSQPPMTYISHWRMQLAIDWLLSSELSISKIAERIGYESEVAFRAAFKKFIGCPPARFRAQGGHYRSE